MVSVVGPASWQRGPGVDPTRSKREHAQGNHDSRKSVRHLVCVYPEKCCFVLRDSSVLGVIGQKITWKITLLIIHSFVGQEKK